MAKKPNITSIYAIEHVLECEGRVQFVSLDKSCPSFQTIPFPKGTKITVLVEHLPAVEEKK